MKKRPCRIVSRVDDSDNSIKYIIQRRRWWRWYDVKDPNHPSIFDTIDRAIKGVKYFDGTYKTETVVWKNYDN